MEQPREELPREVSGGTWTLGLASWVALLIGMPFCNQAFIGCFGALVVLAALGLALVFVVRVVRDTRGARSQYRPLGLIGVLAALGLAGWSATKPAGVFGYEAKWEATRRYHLDGPISPTVEQRMTVWREAHPWWENGLLWLAAAVLLPWGLRLLGSTSVPWLVVSALAAGAAGPISLAICLRLAEGGAVSWN